MFEEILDGYGRVDIEDVQYFSEYYYNYQGHGDGDHSYGHGDGWGNGIFSLQRATWTDGVALNV